MKKLVVALAVLAASAGAYAAEGSAAGQSEFYHQAAAGEHEGTASLGVVVTGTEEATPDDADVTGTRLAVGYEMGINEAWAIGGTLRYTQLKVDDNGTKTDRTGIENLLVNLRGKHAGVEGLRYGAQLSLALGKGEIETNGDENVQDGGISIAPYVGFEWAKNNCAFGGKVAYEVGIQDKEFEVAGTTIEAGGGHATTLAAFYEHTMNDTWTLGGSLTYAMTSDLEPEGQADIELGNTTAIEVYAPIRAVGPGTLIPSITSSTTSADGGDAASMTAEVAYRMGF